jgi:hypothetical protein
MWRPCQTTGADHGQKHEPRGVAQEHNVRGLTPTARLQKPAFPKCGVTSLTHEAEFLRSLALRAGVEHRPLTTLRAATIACVGDVTVTNEVRAEAEGKAMRRVLPGPANAAGQTHEGA